MPTQTNPQLNAKFADFVTALDPQMKMGTLLNAAKKKPADILTAFGLTNLDCARYHTFGNQM